MAEENIEKSDVPGSLSAEDRNHMQRLTRAIERLADRKFVSREDSTVKLLWAQFLRGMAFGLGSFLGATILVSVLVLFLSRMEVVPIIGDFAARILVHIENATP